MEIRAKQAFAMAKRGQARPALFIDLDHFKPVNDELGHDVGDMLLKEASARMRTMLRERDSLVRSGGGEFLVLLTHFNDEGDVLSVAEKIRNAVSGPTVQARRRRMQHRYRLLPRRRRPAEPEPFG